MIADSYFRTRKEAENEVRRRKRDPAMSGTITTIFRIGIAVDYGGVSRSFPAYRRNLPPIFSWTTAAYRCRGFDVLTGKAAVTRRARPSAAT